MTATESASHIWSPSQLIDYANCANSWARRKLWGQVPTDRSYPLDSGSTVHTCIERYNRACWDMNVEAKPELMTDIVNAVHKSDEWLVPEDDYQEVLGLCARTAYRQKLDVAHLVDVEGFLWMRVNGHRFRCKPDLLLVNGNTATVPDYKTSRAIWTEDDIAKDFKSRCYAAAVMDEENFPQVDAVTVVMDFARYGVTPDHTFDKRDAEATKEEIYQRIQKAEADMEYKATPCSWCALCRYRSDCDVVAAAILNARNMVDVVADPEQAAFVMAEIVALDVALKNRKKALAPWTEHTPVRSGDQSYGPHEVVKTSADADRVYEAFLGTENGPWPWLNANVTALKAEVKRKKKREPGVDVAALLIETVKTKMELHKVEVADE